MNDDDRARIHALLPEVQRIEGFIFGQYMATKSEELFELYKSVLNVKENLQALMRRKE